jgi:glycosyltransferase involved in cell wall biosynthesis
VSIVLPCYNVRDYISECLDSIINQTYRELQVIAVNDGSTDDTLTILQSYSDPRLLIVDQLNQGLGGARNSGYVHAKGRFVTFVDSDDYLARDAVANLVRAAEKTAAEITIGARVKFNAKRSAVSPERLFSKPLRGVRPIDHPSIYGLIAVHGKLFRTDFLEKYHISFQEIRAQEDASFTYVAYSRAERVTVVTEPTYFYRKRDPGQPSITQARLKRRNLLGRMAQMETTLALYLDGDGQRTTVHTTSYRLEFGSRLMRHITKIPYSDDSKEVAEAIDVIYDFTIAYEMEIRKYCSNIVVQVYEAIWKKDLSDIARAVNSYFEARRPATASSK